MSPQPPSDLPLLRQVIASEADEIRLFTDLLRTEQQALTNGDTDRLADLAAKKDKIAVRLKKLTEQRNAELLSQGCPANGKGMDEWCAKHPKDIDIVKGWTLILTLANEAKELNRINGELIKVRMDYNSKALEVLRHGDDPFELYGPDGQSKKSGLKRINDAV